MGRVSPWRWTGRFPRVDGHTQILLIFHYAFVNMLDILRSLWKTREEERKTILTEIHRNFVLE